MKLSPKQEHALARVRGWLDDPSAPQVFYLAGVAGSGKSTILKYALGELAPRDVCYMAPTGKAALVMRRKGCPGASTVHSVIYRCAGDAAPSADLIAQLKTDLERLRKIDDPGAQATAKKIAAQIERAESGKAGGPRFSLKVESDLRRAKVGVIDECSMIDKLVGADLESFGTKLLVVGDPAQLPPVYGAGYFTSREPDVFLDEIHRQALGSPILMLADLARRGERLPYGDHGDGVRVVRSMKRGGESQIESARSAEMILVGRNATRHAINHKIRRLLGRDGAPVPGDRAICRRNDHELGLLNGSSWKIERCVPDLESMSAKLDVVAIDGGDQIECDAWLHHFMAREDELKNVNNRRGRQEFAYGFAQTVHTCLALDTLVETPRGLERLDEITDQGTIATHEGPRPYGGRVFYPPAAMFRVTTRSGYTLDTTDNHGVFVWNRARGYERKTTAELAPGEVIQFLLEAVCEPRELASLPGEPSIDVRSKRYTLPSQVTEDVAEWLGLMVGDGTVFHRGFRLAKRHLDVVERFEWLCRSIFGASPKRFDHYGPSKIPVAEVASRQLADWCLSIVGLAPNQKAVPRAIRCSPLRVQARFLRGLFEDGTVNLKGDKLDHIEWSSCYEQMAREVQIMLLRYGIISSRRERDGQWMLYIYGVHAHRFRDLIGFVASFKNQRLFAPTGAERRYRVPLTRAEIKDLHLPQFQRQNAHATGYLSRDVASQHAARSAVLRERMRYFHDEIATITRLPDAPSGCVTVPSLGRFLQNGSPQANSQGSQYDDVLLFDESSQFNEPAKHLYTGITRAAKALTVVV